VTLTEGRIDESGIQRLRDLIDHPLRNSFQFNTEVTYDGLRHLVWGVGDDNPLWLDPAYALASPYGRQIAPPQYLYTIHHTLVQVGLPGVHGFHSGTTWRLHRPLYVGEKPTALCWIADVVERPSKFGGTSVFIYFRTAFGDEQGRLIADSLSYTIRVERAKSRQSNKEGDVTMKSWSPEELQPVEDEAVAAQRRGGEPRLWDDVEVGQQLERLIKGPLCLTDMVAWYAGSNQVYHPGFAPALKHYRRHPNWAFRDPQFGVLQPNARVHDLVEVAQAAGVPGPYDIGVQRHQWLFQLLTDWIGDAGFVTECSAQYRKFNLFGDIQYLNGTVTGKRVVDGEHLVDLEVWAENQRGEVTMPGTATVALPDRTGGSAPARRHAESALTVRDFVAETSPALLEHLPH
jgi:acyl dehydratase